MRTPRPWALPQQPLARANLLAPGVSRAMLETQVRAGRLLRLRTGVYLAAARWPDDPVAQHLVRAHAEQVALPDAVISHHSAALAWGLPYPGIGDWDTSTISLSMPRSGRHRSSDSVVLHRPSRLPPHHITQDRDGYRVTTLARTCVDLARDLDVPSALVLLDAAARKLCNAMIPMPRRGDYANPRLAEAARASIGEALATCRAAGLSTALRLANPARESPIESLTAGHLHLSGLPMPQFQPPIRTAGSTFYPDCLWPEHQLIGEADGARKYADAGAYVAEKEREQILRDLGYDFVRWLGREILLQPWTVMERIARALRG